MHTCILLQCNFKPILGLVLCVLYTCTYMLFLYTCTHTYTQEHSRDQFGWMHVDLFLPSLMNSLTSVSESLLQMGLAVRGKRRDAAAPKQVPPPNLPSMGETVEVIVPTAISPAEFYVQLVRQWLLLPSSSATPSFQIGRASCRERV